MKRGRDLVRQGEPADGFYLVQSGLVRLYHLTSAGKTGIVRLLGPGELLGLSETISGDAHLLSAEAVETTRVEHVAGRELRTFLKAHPQVAVDLLAWLAREVRHFFQGLCATSVKEPLSVRLWHNLVEMSETCGDSTAEGVLLSPRLTVQDLAHGLGCSRQWTSKLLGQLRDGGWIERRGRRIMLPGDALRSTSEPAGDAEPSAS